MKVIKLVGALLLLANLSCAFAQNVSSAVGLQAETKFELAGPSSVSEGSNANFTMKLDYAPKDLSNSFTSVAGVQNAIAWVNFSYIFDSLYFEIFKGTDVISSSGQIQNSLKGQLLPAMVNIDDKGFLDLSANRNFIGNDPDLSFAQVVQYSFSNLAVGDYTIHATVSSQTVIYNAPTTACSVVAACKDSVSGANIDVSIFFEQHEIYQPFSVTAVPEPETYALMLAGLGLIGGIVRRRKQKAITS